MPIRVTTQHHCMQEAELVFVQNIFLNPQPEQNRQVIFPVACFCCSVPSQTAALLVMNHVSLPCSFSLSLVW